jgi:hypothetical protein
MWYFAAQRVRGLTPTGSPGALFGIENVDNRLVFPKMAKLVREVAPLMVWLF